MGSGYRGGKRGSESYLGTLDNIPLDRTYVTLGDPILFRPGHVASVSNVPIIDLNPSRELDHWSALLGASGTVSLPWSVESAEVGLIFDLDDDLNGYRFAMASFGGKVRVGRMGAVLELETPEGCTSAEVSWSPTNVGITFMGKGVILDQASVATIFSIPTPGLLRAAWRMGIIDKRSEYDDLNALEEEVLAGFSRIQKIVVTTGAFINFWDVHYEGKKIKARIPKKEPLVHPLLHALLHDYCKGQGIEVIPEYQTGVGNADFLFLAPLASGDLGKVCCEVKLAHSKDALAGIETQLPAYMEDREISHGVYCVLWFRGDWFDDPDMDRRARAGASRGRERCWCASRGERHHRRRY